MKRNIQISLAAFLLSLAVLLKYTWATPEWAERWPQDVEVWKYATLILGTVFFTLATLSLDWKRLAARRAKDCGLPQRRAKIVITESNDIPSMTFQR